MKTPRYIKEGAAEARRMRAERRRELERENGRCAWCHDILFPDCEVQIDGLEYHATCSIMVRK